jgi:hypothetical protein
MFIKISKKFRLAFTVTEVLIASGLFGLAGLALGSIYLFSTRTFAAMANYATLDQNNRLGMDKMTREIRQARAIMQATNVGNTAVINLIANNGDSITYTFDPQLAALTRTVNSTPPQIVIPNCEVLQFDVRQRTPENDTNFDEYPRLSTNDSIQVITLTWRAWKRIPGSAVGTSEEIQTADVVVRNQRGYQANGGLVFSE